MTGKEAELIFKQLAFRKGFKYKVPGDYAYARRMNDPASRIIKLISAKGNRLFVYEEGIGRYEVEVAK